MNLFGLSIFFLKVASVRDGILKLIADSMVATPLLNNLVNNINQKKKSIREVVQGEFLEIFSSENVSGTKYLAKVLSIKEDVIEAVLLADDRPIKEQFLARFTGSTGKVQIGFDLLGRSVDALGFPLDNFDVNSFKNIKLKKKALNKVKILSNLNNFRKIKYYSPFFCVDNYDNFLKFTFLHWLISDKKKKFASSRSKIIFFINSTVKRNRAFHYNSIFFRV
jgi:hypothetical protein